jgi:hypothetical protein
MSLFNVAAGLGFAAVALYEGVKKLFVGQCSIAVCHFRIRLRRGIVMKKMRVAQPPIANDNRTLNNEQFLHTFYELLLLCKSERQLCAMECIAFRTLIE